MAPIDCTSFIFSRFLIITLTVNCDPRSVFKIGSPQPYCRVNQARRNTQRAAAERRVQVGLVEQHRPNIRRFVVPNLGTADVIALAIAWRRGQQVDHFMAHIDRGPHRSRQRRRDPAEQRQLRPAEEQARDADRRDSHLPIAGGLFGQGVAQGVGALQGEAHERQHRRMLLKPSAESAIRIALETQPVAGKR